MTSMKYCSCSSFPFTCWEAMSILSRFSLSVCVHANAIPSVALSVSPKHSVDYLRLLAPLVLLTNLGLFFGREIVGNVEGGTDIFRLLFRGKAMRNVLDKIWVAPLQNIETRLQPRVLTRSHIPFSPWSCWRQWRKSNQAKAWYPCSLPRGSTRTTRLAPNQQSRHTTFGRHPPWPGSSRVSRFPS